MVLYGGTSASAQIYVVDYRAGTVGEYSLSGGNIDPSLITGLQDPWQLRVQGNDLWLSSLNLSNDSATVAEYSGSGSLINNNPFPNYQLTTPVGFDLQGNEIFFVDYFAGTVSEYDTSGNLVNSSLGTAPVEGQSVRLSGNDIFVMSSGAPLGGTGLPNKGAVDTISEFTTSGTTISTSFVTSPNANANPMMSFAVAGNDIFFTTLDGAVSEYTTSGTPVNNFTVTVPGNQYINAIAVDGDNLLIASTDSFDTDGMIGEYSMTGAPINPSLITGLQYVSDIEVVVPEPTSMALTALSAIAILRRRRRTWS